MSEAGLKVEEAKEQIEAVTTEVVTNPWIERLMRFGLIVRGVLYCIVGVLAVQVALGAGGDTTDKGGAIAAIGAQPLGRILLILVAIGLAGYTLWGLVRAIVDPLKKGKSLKGLAERGGYLLSALSYATLLVPTVQVIFGAGVEDGEIELEIEEGEIEIEGGDGNIDFTAGLLSSTFGPWIVAVVGLIVIGGGLGEWYRAISGRFKKDFRLERMSEGELRLAMFIGRFGHAARGVVFMMIGYFLVKAGFLDNAYQAVGLDGALAALARQELGPALLLVVALGLVSFGVFSMLCARWNKVVDDGR